MKLATAELERFCEIDLAKSFDACEIVMGRRPALLRGSVWLLVILIAASGIFAALTQVDDVVDARGIVDVAGEGFKVDAPFDGTVLEVNLEPGSAVEKGDLLVRLDSTALTLRKSEIDEVLVPARRREREIVGALVKQAKERLEAQARTLDDAVELARVSLALRRDQVERKRREHEFRVRSDEERERLFLMKQEGYDKMDENAAAEFEREIARAERQLARFDVEEARADRESFEKAAGDEIRQAEIEASRTEAARDLARAESGISLGELDLRSAELDREIESLQRESERLTEEIARHVIRARESGVLTEVHVNRAGEVVRAGELIAKIDPRGDYLIRALVRNQDAGKLWVGLPAKIKFDPFPYQEYGVFDGDVVAISPDAVDPENRFFEIRVSCRWEEFRRKTGAAEGERTPLGYAAGIEVVTGRQSLLARLFGRPAGASR